MTSSSALTTRRCAMAVAIGVAAAMLVAASPVAAAAAGTLRAACIAKHYPSSAGFFGALGATTALVFANLGSAYGTAKAACGISSLGVKTPDRIMRGLVPVIMAGILGIYGLIIAVIINNNIKTDTYAYSSFAGYMHLASGMAAGLSSMAAGLAIGIVGDSAVRSYAKQEKVFVIMILMLIFAEALGLYGLIIALVMNNTAGQYGNVCANFA